MARIQYGSTVFDIDPCDELVVNEIFRDNVYQYHPKPGMRILDIGAQKGIFAIHAALHGANVWSHEPCPDSFEKLLTNVVTNGVGSKVIASNTGVWSEDSRMTLYIDPKNSGGNSLFGKGEGVRVNLLKFDDVIGNSDWDVVKIDTEGAEFEILTKASTAALKRIKYLTVEVHNSFPLELYDAMMSRLAEVFTWDGVKEITGRLNYIYARQK